MDDAIRNAITKMSWLHFVSNSDSRKRVIQMGENTKRVYNVGNLGTERIKKIQTISKEQLSKNFNVIFLTKKGMVRKNKLVDVAKSGTRELRETGKLSIKLKEKDILIGVDLARDNQDIMLSTTDGKCLRFPVKSLRLFSGLNSGGVKGIKLEKNNFVVSLSILQHSRIDMSIRQEYLKSSSENRKNGSGFINNNDFEELQKKEEFILSVTSNGFGKRSSAYEYRISSRGGKGITGILTTPKNSLIKQYQKLFEMENVKLTFTKDALSSIADFSIKKQSGARGLRSILESILLDTMYKLPTLEGLEEVVINADVDAVKQKLYAISL